ncbi:sialin-like [Bacillus rossius redtenbacheri]|uniref:sialin-like n=1 Tax=Bacillus rossius redtenbacheri TaxID=93214 RepID=UPI002FDD6CDD
MVLLDDEESPQATTGRKCHVPARYVFAGVSTLGALLNVVLKSSLPVAITAMVRKNASNASGEGDGKFDWDEVTQSYVLTAGSYGMLCSCLAGARLAELWSPKMALGLANALGGALYLLLPVTAAWSVRALIALQALGGLLGGPVIPINMGMFASWFPPEERQQLGGIVFSSTILAVIISSAMTGKIVDTLGWPFIFYLFPSLVIAWSALWMIFVFDSPETHPRISEEERSYIIKKTKKDHVQTASKLPWKEMLLSRAVWAYIIMGIPGVWVMSTLGMALPTYMTNILGYTTTQAGYFSAIPQLFSWISTITFGFVSQWLRRKQYLGHLLSYHIFNGISTLGTAAALFSILLVDRSAAGVISLVTLAMAFSGAYMGGSQLNHMDLSVNYTGTLAGLSTMTMGVVSILAPTVTGLLTNNKQTLSAWNYVFCVAGGVNIIPFIIYLFFGSVDEQPWNTKRNEVVNNYVSVSEQSRVPVEDN